MKRLVAPSARTRWVTERIASAHLKSGKEKTGSSQSLQNRIQSGRPEEKPGTKTFYLLTARPNGRPLFGPFSPSQIYHWPAQTPGVTNNWQPLNESNEYANNAKDHAQFSITGNPMYGGGFDIDIPMRWRIDTGSDEHLFPNRLQSCEITGSGSGISAGISKLKQSAHQP
jgi:hypothetical protein